MKMRNKISKTKYKVVLIHNIISPYVISLFEELTQAPSLDLKIFFLSELEKNRRWRVKKDFKFAYKVLPGMSVNFSGKDLFTYWINPTIIYHLIKNNFDVLITAGYDSFTSHISFFICKLLRKPFILWTGSTVNEANWRRTVSLPWIRFIVTYSDGYIAYGARAREYLFYLGAKEERVFTAANTVNLHHFSERSRLSKTEKNKLKDRLHIKNKKVILYVGQLIERKGLKSLIKAFDQLRRKYENVSLVLVGYGYQEEELKGLCRKQCIKDVYFTGYIDINDIPKFYGIADLFVLASTEEVWGLVINEAMACGLPIVTTDKVGASVDLVKEGTNGYVVEHKNTAQLYEAMEKIILNSFLQKKMGEQSRKIIQNFGLDNTVNGFVSAIEYVVNSEKG